MPVTPTFLEKWQSLVDKGLYRKATFCFVGLMALISFATLGRHGETVDESFGEQRSNYYGAYLKHVLSGQGVMSFHDYLARNNYNGPRAFFEYGGMWPLLHTYVTERLNYYFKIPRFPGLHVPYVMLFYGSLVAFGLLARRLLGWRGAFLAVVLLTLHPNLFHHLQNNPKDVPAMGFVVLAAYTFVVATERKQRRYALAAAWFLAAAITTKMDSSVLLAAFALGWLDYLRRQRPGEAFPKWLEGHWQPAAWFACAFALLAVLMWPSIWFDFGRVVRTAKHFSGSFHNFEGLYLGQFYLSPRYPRHYIPVQLAVATPVIELVLFCLGAWGLLFARRFHLHADRWKVFLFAMFLCPILPRSLPGAVVYNGFRHVFPALPFLILIAAAGAERALREMESRDWHGAALAAQGIVLLWLTVECASFFPHGNAYFNEVARLLWPNRVHTMFETDYYSSSYLQGVEWLNANSRPNSRACLPVDAHTIWSYPKRKDLKFACDLNFEYLVLYGKFFNELHKPENIGRWGTESLKLVHTVSRRGIDILRIYERTKVLAEAGN